MGPHTKYLKFYLGCQTNKGQLTGITGDSLFIKVANSSTENYKLDSVGVDIFLYLRRLGSLSDQERSELITKGFNIGRPSGYSFSLNAFLFLVDLNVDLFGLIETGLAKDVHTVYPE